MPTPNPILITGCSSGIGLETTRYLAHRGVPVYATVRTESDAERVGALDGVEAFLCDVTSDESVHRLREAIDARGAGLGGIVHNAGVAQLGLLSVTPLEDVRAVFEVNVFGVHRVTNALLDLILASRGRIVTMSSISGTISSPLVGAYSMSKHALEAYTDALAAELEPHGVRVCAVVPGNFDSAIIQNMARRFSVPPGSKDDLVTLYGNPNEQTRTDYPTPEPVAAACHAALFDADPLARYLVVPGADEADRTLATAAREWARLNESTPHRWSLERLGEEIAGGRPNGS